MLSILIQFYRFTLPGLYLSALWSIYRILFKNDEAMGYVLFLSVMIIVDNYLNTGIYIPGVPVGSIRYSEVVFGVIYFKFYKKKSSKIDRIVFNFLLLYFLIFLVAAFRAEVVSHGVFYYRGYFIPQILAIMIGFKGLGKPENYIRFFYYFSILLIFMGLFVLWDQFYQIIFLKSSSISEAIYYANRKDNRFGSFFLNPNMYGSFIVLIIFSTITSLFFVQKKYEQIIMLGGIMLTLLGMVLTHSRGPLLSFAAAIALYVLMPNSKFSFPKRMAGLFMVTLLLFIAMPGFFESATRRFSEEQSVNEESTDEVNRISIWLTTIELINNHPILGVGLGEATFRAAVRRETDYLLRHGHMLDNPHSSYLQIAVESGVPNLILFLLINMVILRRALKALIIENDKRKKMLLSGLIPGIIGYLLTLSFDMSMFTRVAPVYWMLLGFTYCISKSDAEDEISNNN